MKISFSSLILCVLLTECASWKSSLVSQGSRNEAIQNAIIDFTHSDKLYQKDNLFWVHTVSINDSILAVGIFGTSHKFQIYKDKSKYDYKAIPTGYLQQKDKIFYWDDSTKQVDEKLVRLLASKNLTDTIPAGQFYHVPIGDESKKAANYFFYKGNLKRYRRVHTSLALGYYKAPKFKHK
ncbi:hypothetical protein [Hymenobacter cheonanensis]|uniref:hypothetical protein n=1 Tax=Hymenobacter sp. CA2-7 TaxID=3063993 RepID=UPI0027134D78|nr:hypothetical protein [Hymenobacter sp. CA2-7]MDO7886563.1 hypothetical protein [Hymenobacter sp. CA2-7]